MKRALLFLTLVVAVLALPQLAESQDTAAVQEKVRWLNSFAMSGAAYHAQMQMLGLATKAASPAPSWPPDPDPYPYSSYVATNDNPSQDVEPTISNVWVGGAPYVTTAYISYPAAYPHLPLLRTVTTSTSFTSFTPSTLSLPAPLPGQPEFQQEWDPFLAANNGGVVAPRRLYAIGIAGSYTTPLITAVVLWRSEDGGLTWSAPVIIDDNHLTPSGPTGFFLDKPHVVVNPNSGYVFVTYLAYSTATHGLATTHFSLSTNGGISFAAPTALFAGTIGGPQLAVNSGSNNLYLVWADYASNRLFASTSVNNGSSWGSPVGLTPSIGQLVGPMPTEVPQLSNGIHVFSLPMVRYNPVADVLGVTWHQREDTNITNPVPTDVYYSYFNGSAWATPIAVSAIAGQDEFMPALDSNASGYISITYYSTYGSIGNVQYREWLAYCSFSGAEPMTHERLSPLWSNPHNYTIIQDFIGDYQDGTSIRGLGYNQYVSAWVGIDASYNTAHGDIYLTDVSP